MLAKDNNGTGYKKILSHTEMLMMLYNVALYNNESQRLFIKNYERKIIYMVYDYNTLESRGAPVLLQC